MNENEGAIQNKLLLTITALGIIWAYFYEFRSWIVAVNFLRPLVDSAFAITGLLFTFYLILLFTRYCSGSGVYKLPFHFDPDLHVDLDPHKVDKLYDRGVQLLFLTFIINLPVSFAVGVTNALEDQGFVSGISYYVAATSMAIILTVLPYYLVKKFLGKASK